MTKQREMLFNETHKLEYGLEMLSRTVSTKNVNSLQYQFCIAFEKKGQKTAAAFTPKRNVTENIKYFTRFQS